MLNPASLKQKLPKLVTWTLVVAAALSATLLYHRWVSRPWTRDGQVRADIVKVSPQVSGNLIEVAVSDNQFVSRGELLFRIDPDTYQLAIDDARVALDQARQEVRSLEASVAAAQATADQGAVKVVSAQRNISVSEAGVKSAEAALESAKAGVISAEQLIHQRQAELDNAKSEAVRAKRLVEKKAGSIEDAESTAATQLAREAQLASARAGLTQAKAALAQADVSLSEANINLALAKDALTEAKTAEVSARAARDQAQATLGVPGEENVRIRTAKVSLAQAELNLSRTRIVSPCNGYISNLAISAGTYAVVGQPLVAVVDRDSFRIHAYFQETKLQHINTGDAAVVTLMSHPDVDLIGTVENVGSAVNPPNIAPTEGQPGEVPQIQPTFDWVRLPQRVPVRIRINEIPPGIQLISGTTASVAVRPANEE